MLFQRLEVRFGLAAAGGSTDDFYRHAMAVYAFVGATVQNVWAPASLMPPTFVTGFKAYMQLQLNCRRFALPGAWQVKQKADMPMLKIARKWLAEHGVSVQPPILALRDAMKELLSDYERTLSATTVQPCPLRCKVGCKRKPADPN